jgi:predicted glycoside hydrolase/deacetylase ChbG (UPF0249 family)
MPAASIRLVVSGDGFGTSAGRNRGILTAHRRGILTSTCVLGNADAPAALAAELASAPELGTGVLLALTGGGPVAPPGRVPTLVDPDGRFPPSGRDFLLAWAKAALRGDEIEREFDAQVGRWRELGVRVDHLATLHHLGALPMVAAAAERIARRHGIAGLRTAVEKPSLGWVTDLPRGLLTAGLGTLAWYSRRQLGALRHGPQSSGHFEAGRLDEIRLLEFIGRLGPGSHELLCAPELEETAVPPPRSEASALCSPRVRESLRRRAIELCRWGDLF